MEGKNGAILILCGAIRIERLEKFPSFTPNVGIRKGDYRVTNDLMAVKHCNIAAAGL
jgi:hypothetical protein